VDPRLVQAVIRGWRGCSCGRYCLPDVVETKDTPTGEINGARFAADRPSDDGPVYDDHPERSRWTKWYRTIMELAEQGTDVLHLACEEGRRAVASPSAGCV